MIFEID